MNRKEKRTKKRELKILEDFMCEMKSMQGMTRELNTEEAIQNIAQICGLELEEIPHCDTIKYK